MKRRWLLAVMSLFIAGCGYNKIQTLDEQASAAQGNIEAQLQRRADLVPNLVNTVKGYAQHEEAVFTQVAAARSGLVNAIRSKDASQMANADAAMNSALGRLIAVAEAYPQLKADQGFLRLQDELTGTENRIAVSRTDYNEAVRQYNAYIRQFPQTVTAKVSGAKPRKYYEVSNAGNREAPKVDFGAPVPSAPPVAPTPPPTKTP
jgi:LemA protein